MLNPVVPIVETFRYAFTGNGTFSLFYLIVSFVVTIIILIIGMLVFNRVEKTFMDTI